jgi:cysteine desulfurase/selenocysteine lyase
MVQTVMQQQSRLDPEAVRSDFPTLQRTVNDQQIAYLDNAATTQKPRQVIDAISEYYGQHNANVHRCVHTLAEEATERYDRAHHRVASFISAASWREIVFTKNATEAANLVAYAYGMNELTADDEILLTGMEHHSMIVPWQQVAEKTGATVRFVDVTDTGELAMDEFHAKLSADTAVVGVTHASNVLGTVNPVQDIVDAAHAHDAICVVDGAQSVPHMPVDVQELDADFLFFSGHKLCGPTGIGVLYGKQALLETMDPFLYGGDMIKHVTMDGAEWNDLPWKFEAGTPNVAGAVGLTAAIDYITDIGMDMIRRHGDRLGRNAYTELQQIDDVTVYGPEERVGLVAFTVGDAHPHDLSTLLNETGIAIRGGHHCAQPLAQTLETDATARASFYLYNTDDEVERLGTAVREAADLFR